MDNIRQMAWAHRDSPYFQFAWSSSLNIWTLNGPLSTDSFLEDTLVFLQNEKLLENTILVLISDHGFRTGPVMYEFQGRIENRMPFTYFVFPQSFKGKYAAAIDIMTQNQEHLTTPYDVYETLKDISALATISNERVLEERIHRLELGNERGISLFLPIPLNRTCATAGIDEQWCICNTYAILTETKKCAFAENLGNFIVTTLNTWLVNFPNCSQFQLRRILQIEVMLNHDEINMESYIKTGIPCSMVSSVERFNTFKIIISVSPSNAQFEAVVYRAKSTGQFVMSTEIARISKYGDQSSCIDEYTMKKICYCTPKPK